MGQHLSVQIKQGDDLLLSIQYRWCAYTASAADFLSDLMWKLEPIKLSKNREQTVYRLMRMCELMGGSLLEETPSSIKMVEELGNKYGRGHKFVTARNNDGQFYYTVRDWLTAFHDNCHGWITIDLIQGDITFDVFSHWDRKDEWPELKKYGGKMKKMTPPCYLMRTDLEGLRDYILFLKKMAQEKGYVMAKDTVYTAIC